MHSKALHFIVKIEYLILALFVAIFYVKVGRFDIGWYWLPVVFFAFDLSMVGYLINTRIGALTYNAGHSLVGPGLLAIAYILTLNEVVLFITTVWLFHIFVDRTFGFGLKHATSFQHTHLTPPAKARKK
ncbi:MAG TPA: DUF4260 domain-containing protein [Patescibacteria group bacterium]|jgi:hypothetical protein|nr:DUF4260 domain-containing protein [Patescibacteria group bacterium]